MEGIGNNIRMQRTLKNYSQQYMSFMLEISQGAYSNIESGKTDLTLTRIYEIAEILEISPFQLMPPPKGGAAFYIGLFLRSLFRLKKASGKKFAKKKAEAIKLGIVYRDISKNLD